MSVELVVDNFDGVCGVKMMLSGVLEEKVIKNPKEGVVIAEGTLTLKSGQSVKVGRFIPEGEDRKLKSIELIKEEWFQFTARKNSEGFLKASFNRLNGGSVVPSDEALELLKELEG